MAAFVLVLAGMVGAYLAVDRTDGDGDAGTGGTRELSVFLCLRTSARPDCGRKDATGLEKDAIKKRLEGIAEVRSVVYQSREQAWAVFRKEFAGDKDLIRAARPEELPDSFRVQVEDERSGKEVKAALDAVPGVDTIVFDGRPSRA